MPNYNNILDIKFYKDKAYVLKKINVTSFEVENQIKTLKYSGNSRLYDIEVENANLPPFVLAFYTYIFEFQRIPNENELIDLYLEMFFKIEEMDIFKSNYGGNDYKFSKESLESRFFRSYPTLIREFHFYLKCSESNYFDKVKYSFIKDYEEGIDISLKFKEKDYGLKLYLNSERANFYHDLKINRHKINYSKEISIPFNLILNADNSSEIKLYSNDSLEKLKTLIYGDVSK